MSIRPRCGVDAGGIGYSVGWRTLMSRNRSAHPATVNPTPLKVQGAPPQVGAGQPYSVEYYYKLPWGRQEEFLQLFLKNHYPLLQKIRGTGRILALKIETPAYHT